MTRYLTPEEKRLELATWREILATVPKAGERDGGRGLVDADIVPWCDRLNEIPGVCTIQSCAGHGNAVAGHVGSPGVLWLRLSQELSAALDADAFRLSARKPYIEQVSRFYASWGKEIASITFAGNERDSLHRSMRLIVAFFRSLHAKAHADQRHV